MNPAFSYYGGKQRIARHILPVIDEIPHTVYGEPFCGGASVLYARDARTVANSDHYREYLNDKNEWVTTFYRVGKLQPDELLTLIDATLYSESAHAKAKGILKNSENYSDLEIAWAFYVQANMSFANKLGGGWASTVNSGNRGAVWVSRRKHLSNALARLSEVAISCSDAISCIKRWDSPQTLHYIDPPYPGADQGHYSGYTIEDYMQLCDCLDTIHGSYILSNYPQSIEPKSAQKKVEIQATSSASAKGKVGADKSQMPTQESLGDRKRTEVLWVCDRSHNMRPDIAKIVEPKRQMSLF